LRVPLPSSEQQRLRLRLVQVSLVLLEPPLLLAQEEPQQLVASVQRRLRLRSHFHSH
jgi:hypothetical protein